MRQLFNGIDLHLADNLHELSTLIAAALVRSVQAAVREKAQCSLALSGGDTPRELYRLLGSQFRDEIPWASVHVFWGDERYVPADHPDSNYRMAREALLDHVPCPEANIHPMPTHHPSPEVAARDYERTLRQHFESDGPRFDVNLLGIGADGHTASLFAGSPALTERTHWVMSVASAGGSASRLTLTLPALTRSASIFVLVSGANKAGALRHALSKTPDPDACPAAGLRQSRGRLTWWADRDAVSQLDGLTSDEDPAGG